MAFVWKKVRGPAVGADDARDPAPTEPAEWQLMGCECSQASSGFCFLSPFVYDYKRYVLGPDFDNLPVGTVLMVIAQRIKVDVPQCHGPPLEVLSPVMSFRIRKVSANTIKWELIQ